MQPILFTKKDILIILHNDILQQRVIAELQLVQISKEEIATGVAPTGSPFAQQKVSLNNEILKLTKTLTTIEAEIRKLSEKEEKNNLN